MSKKVAFLVAPEGIEQVELTEPWKAVTDAGHEAVLVSTESGTVQMFNHLDKGDTMDVDVTVDSATLDDYRRPRAPRRRGQPRRPAHERRRGRLRP